MPGRALGVVTVGGAVVGSLRFRFYFLRDTLTNLLATMDFKCDLAATDGLGIAPPIELNGPKS
jgi:hypothetical protein